MRPAPQAGAGIGAGSDPQAAPAIASSAASDSSCRVQDASSPARGKAIPGPVGGLRHHAGFPAWAAPDRPKTATRMSGSAAAGLAAAQRNHGIAGLPVAMYDCRKAVQSATAAALCCATKCPS